MIEYTVCPDCRRTDRTGQCGGCAARVWRRLRYRRSDRQGYYTSMVMPLTGGTADRRALALEREEAGRHIQAGFAEVGQPSFWPVQLAFGA